jgi:hypothetical protein
VHGRRQRAHAITGTPELRLQSRQWHKAMVPGSALSWYRIAPH